MEKELWNKIAEDYEMAKKYLWGQKDALNWRRDDEQGYYYLWCAYHAAIMSEEKDSLLYARIPPKVNMKTDQLLRQFILTGGFEVDMP